MPQTVLWMPYLSSFVCVCVCVVLCGWVGHTVGCVRDLSGDLIVGWLKDLTAGGFLILTVSLLSLFYCCFSLFVFGGVCLFFQTDSFPPPPTVLV